MPEQLAQLVTIKGDRISFSWDPGTDLPVTIKAYNPAGGLQQTANLPREAARCYWIEMIDQCGFSVMNAKV